MKELKKGALLQHGAYRIEKVLGQGGFGITYLATDVSLERRVAVKEFFLKDYCDRAGDTSHVTLGTSGSREFVERMKAKFLKEARNIARLDHPGVIRIHAAFEENNTAYYVMDYIEGESLAERVRRGGPLGMEEALRVIRSAGEALEYVHRQHINHLDVKPANVMVRRSDGRAVLIDFGLSKRYDSEGNQTSTTPIGISHGYAPLEQYAEGGIGAFSPESDVYSLAATLYFLVSGIALPHATSLVEDTLPFPDGFPAPFMPAIEKAMSSTRRNRYHSVSLFLSALQPEDEATEIGVTAEHSVATHDKPRPDGGSRTTKKSESSWRNWAIIAGALITGALASFAITMKRSPSGTSPEENPEVSVDSIPTEENDTVETTLGMGVTGSIAEDVDENQIYDIVEENPDFPGGEEACMKWLSDNIRYPSICVEQGIQGRVYAQFVVNKDGSIVDIKIVRSPNPYLSKETERVLKMMPKWSPGKQKGKPVRVKFSLPMMFRLTQSVQYEEASHGNLLS